MANNQQDSPLNDNERIRQRQQREADDSERDAGDWRNACLILDGEWPNPEHHQSMVSRNGDGQVSRPAEFSGEISEPLESSQRALQSESQASVNSSPPAYEHVAETEPKRPLSNWDSNLGDSTDVKHPVSADDSDSDDDDGDVSSTIKDKDYLLREIKSLQKEQKELRQRQEQHEQHIRKLLQQEPSINRQFRSIRRSTKSGKSFLGKIEHPSELVQQTLSKEQHIYVQLEQLYANYQVLHLPNKTVESILGKFDPDQELKNENRSLKQKVEALEDKLQKLQRLSTLSPSVKHSQSQQQKLPHAKSEGRLDELGLPQSNQTNQRQKLDFVPGRPTSPLPLPPAPKDICPEETTFTWKITDYSTKLKVELEDGYRQTSSPFYVTHCGYRAQLEVYLNGNGTAINKCMSVFLRVIHGNYDRHLKWPANLHLTVILVNQSDDHSDSLKAAGHRFQFTRPCGTTDGESDCWGLVEFVSHKMIKQKQYILADSIKLKFRIQISRNESYSN